MSKGKNLKGMTYITLENGEELKIKYTMNSLVQLEEDFGDFKNIMEEFKKISFKNIRNLVYAGAIDYNKNITKEYLGKNFDLSTMKDGIEAVKDAFEMAFPKAEGEDDYDEVGKEVLEEAKKKD